VTQVSQNIVNCSKLSQTLLLNMTFVSDIRQIPDIMFHKVK